MKTVTVEKRSNAWLGLGVNVFRPEQFKLTIGFMALPSLGIQAEPFADLPSFRDPGAFVSLVWRP